MSTDPAGRPAHETLGVTPRQADLLVELARGLTVTEAAAALGVTLTTATSHMKAVRQATGERTVPLVLRVHRRGVLPLPATPWTGCTWAGFTVKQVEVIRGAAEGLMDDEIAERLGVDRNTVKARFRLAWRRAQLAAPDYPVRTRHGLAVVGLAAGVLVR